MIGGTVINLAPQLMKIMMMIKIMMMMMMINKGDNTVHSYAFSRSSVNDCGEDIKQIAGRIFMMMMMMMIVMMVVVVVVMMMTVMMSMMTPGVRAGGKGLKAD